MEKGWNLIGLPFTPTLSPSQLVSQSNEITAIWSYQADGWKVYMVNAEGVETLATLESLEGGNGYWVYQSSMAPVTVTLEGSTPTTELNLRAGWNLIGIGNYVENIGQWVSSSNVGSIWGWSDGRWISYVSEVPEFLNNLQVLDSGKGYYLYQEQNETKPITSYTGENGSTENENTDTNQQTEDATDTGTAPQNQAPAITSAATAAIEENNTTVFTVTAYDPNSGDSKQFSVSGGADQSL
ncbi:MAG: hypothetical protein HON27_13290, partial [Candidatus Marinimicrobia bacterium]|nr:hypothetical protein [Candidatus Neomarinimicrobiota bacterium]MBT5270526.1 hypothetical protein [Candidatus Neomarinimicrobiota bacterium]